jgi:tripartite-type tricarboxylate transporter receptor subunit TctC
VFPDMPPLRDSGLDLSAVIYRGLAAPVGLPQEMAERLRTAMQAVVADPEFHEQADSIGFIPSWIDGPTWTARADAERAELARLWATEPWLQEGAG